MSTARAYASKKRDAGAARTRARIMDAVRAMLGDGSFHTASVEQIAERAEVSRATLYQHFGSRLGLVDAICDTVAATEQMQAIKSSAEIEDPVEALEALLVATVEFWSAEAAMHRQLYGLAVIDPAAAEFVERQQRDRTRVMRAAVDRLSAAGLLRDDISRKRVLAQLLVLTSFATYAELRDAGLREREIIETLVPQARDALVIPAPAR